LYIARKKLVDFVDMGNLEIFGILTQLLITEKLRSLTDIKYHLRIFLVQKV